MIIVSPHIGICWSSFGKYKKERVFEAQPDSDLKNCKTERDYSQNIWTHNAESGQNGYKLR